MFNVMHFFTLIFLDLQGLQLKLSQEKMICMRLISSVCFAQSQRIAIYDLHRTVPSLLPAVWTITIIVVLLRLFPFRARREGVIR